jgi:hypothetical protein
MGTNYIFFRLFFFPEQYKLGSHGGGRKSILSPFTKEYRLLARRFLKGCPTGQPLLKKKKKKPHKKLTIDMGVSQKPVKSEPLLII